MLAMRGLFSKNNKTIRVRRMPKQLRELWTTVGRFSAQIQESAFMSDMSKARATHGPDGVMGMIDCATLYGLVRWLRPLVIVESGGYFGMSSAFILKALADEELIEARLYSIEFNKECPHGILIPDNLRTSFVPLNDDVKNLIKGDRLPPKIDMFLHDSSHRYRHMLWEFKEFWKRMPDRGLLVSHDVHFSAAFSEFVAGTYEHDKYGLLDHRRTTHYEWGRWGYIGFIVKKDETPS
jgi:predicted O-methyltransferase YrrM